MTIPQRIRNARFWAICLLLWFFVLNLLSHGDKFHPPNHFFFWFDLPHLDKILHFGYFFGGGGLFAAALFFKQKHPNWMKIILIVTFTLSLVGVWDEYHQSFFKNRTGNDFGDWAADTLGGFFGALVFRAFQRVIL